MNMPRSTYYEVPAGKPDDAQLVATIVVITDEFELYGYRRVTAELRAHGLVVNAKKVRRLMRENDLNPRRRRRFATTTDSDHDGPIFPNLAKDITVDGPNQLPRAPLAPAASRLDRPKADGWPTLPTSRSPWASSISRWSSTLGRDA